VRAPAPNAALASLLVAGVAAAGIAGAWEQVVDDGAAHWAPVVIQHQGERLSESFPVAFGDDGHGEFTVYTWRAGDAGRRWFGYLWQYVSGAALSVVVEIEARNRDGPRIAGALLAGPESCRWAAGETLRRVRDAAGVHPVFSVRAKRLGTGLGDLEPALPGGGVIDWSGVAMNGRQFPRAWQRQQHLVSGTPATFGIVLRHEPAGGYRQAGRSGQGNTPHHWNLLAYRLSEIGPGDPRLRDHPGRPLDWPCADIFADPGGAVDRTREQAGPG